MPDAMLGGFHILSAPNIHPTKPRFDRCFSSLKIVFSGGFREVPSRERENMGPICGKRKNMDSKVPFGKGYVIVPSRVYIELVVLNRRFGDMESGDAISRWWQLIFFFHPENWGR